MGEKKGKEKGKEREQKKGQGKEITIALAGNPNSGKTTVFNNLTGAHQHVGNWPGVTVEKKEGVCRYGDCRIKVVDLPGVYSLTAYSIDELIARNFIVEEEPDVVVDIVDATNLERNLYLTVQLLEMGARLIIALNMMDEASERGYRIDVKHLSYHLGVPVVPMVASRDQGTEELLEEIVDIVGTESTSANCLKIDYGREVEEEIEKLERMVSQTALSRKYPPRWLAVKLLEEDEEILKKFKELDSEEILQAKDRALEHLRSVYGDDVETIIADRRYGFISGLLKDVIKRPPTPRLTWSDKLDKVIVSRWLGIPLFLAIMFAVFQFIFALSGPLMEWIGAGFDWLAERAMGISPDWLGSLIGNGIIGGVGTVLTFIPPIFLLFAAIAVLEDSGYMARAAFVMDRLMHKIGLHGRSFIPMILGFGCNIPAIMATRTIENPRDRLITILINPLMSCGARLPIYTLLAAAFFPAHQGLVVFSMYLIGIILAILMASIFRRLLPGPAGHFVMELPPYRLPTARGVLLHMWERGKHFLWKAGTIIVGVVVFVWLLSSLPWGVEYASPDSWIGQLGRIIAPVFGPSGFGDWQAAVSLFFGFLAKEVVVGTMGAILAVEEGNLGTAIASQLGWTPLIAYAFMVFALLYVPCVAAMAVIKAETGSWRWPALAIGYELTLAWIMATLVYQIGRLLGFG